MRLLSVIVFTSVLVGGTSSITPCPPEEVVLPCTCCDDVDTSITCSGVKNESLDERGIQNALEAVAKHYESLEISPVIDSLQVGYTAVKAVRREMFAGLAFKQIWLNNNFYLCLDRIDKDAFLDSQRSLRVFKATIEINGEATKKHNHDGSVLERFNNFQKLEVLDFMNYHMSSVPNHYYCKYSIPNVKQLWLNVNGIERIEVGNALAVKTKEELASVGRAMLLFV